MPIIFFIICFLASIVGAICGIGGGVIIKPVLDAFGVLSVSVISFLSGCTVLSMTSYSMIKSKMSKDSQVEQETTLPLAIGAAIGGVLGKWIFALLISGVPNQNMVGAVQAGCLLLVTLGTLIYTVNKDKVKTKQVTKMMQNLGVEGKALLVTCDKNDNLYLSARNIYGVDVSYVGMLNVYDILNHGKLIIAKNAVEKLEEVYA